VNELLVPAVLFAIWVAAAATIIIGDRWVDRAHELDMQRIYDAHVAADLPRVMAEIDALLEEHR
jgi:hypothetical protein